MVGRISILIADDHHLVRSAIASFLMRKTGFEVVAECSDGAQVVARALETTPDVALLDISMPGLSGIDLIRVLQRECLATKVIILSMHCNEGFVTQALTEGVRGYVLKDSSVEELEFAIRAVMNGKVYLSPGVSKELAGTYLTGRQGNRMQLTPRQREVLRMLAEGRSARQIAAALGLSVKTVESHRVLLMHRLGIHHLPGLVKYAIRTGLIRSEVE